MRRPCPSLFLGVCLNSCPLSLWCHPAILSSVTPFTSCPPSFPASASLPVSPLFASCGQTIGASASVFSMNIQLPPFKNIKDFDTKLLVSMLTKKFWKQIRTRERVSQLAETVQKFKEQLEKRDPYNVALRPQSAHSTQIRKSHSYCFLGRTTFNLLFPQLTLNM